MRKDHDVRHMAPGTNPADRSIGPVQAVLLSVFGFGLGYVYVGRMRLAFVYFGALLGVFAVAGWTRLVLHPVAVYALAVVALSITLFVLIHCAMLAISNRSAAAKTYNRGWVYVVWIIASMVLAEVMLQSRASIFGYEPFHVPATSMAPTIKQGDFLMTDTWRYDRSAPDIGELVVFGLPTDPRIKYVKRVVGLPGDSIEIRDDILYRNGEAIDEPYILVSPGGSTGMSNFGPVVTPDDHFFMLGDNRHRSRDSRFIGAISRSLLHGRVEHRWFAYNDGILWDRFPERLVNSSQ